MRFDGNLEGSMYMRFLSRMYFDAFVKEFDGFRMAGMVIEVRLADTELPIIPRGRRRNEMGQPRYYGDVWVFPDESDRPGLQVHLE